MKDHSAVRDGTECPEQQWSTSEMNLKYLFILIVVYPSFCNELSTKDWSRESISANLFPECTLCNCWYSVVFNKPPVWAISQISIVPSLDRWRMSPSLSAEPLQCSPRSTSWGNTAQLWLHSRNTAHHRRLEKQTPERKRKWINVMLWNGNTNSGQRTYATPKTAQLFIIYTSQCIY